MRTHQLFLIATLVVARLAGPSILAAPPNIVFILADDLGVNDLACHGRREHATPHLDRLASEGARFTSAYCSQPICSPTRAALMTGKAPARLRLTTYLPGRADAPSQLLLHPRMRQELPLEEITIAERLKAAGYATACVGKWHLGGQGFLPTDQGFDVHWSRRASPSCAASSRPGAARSERSRTSPTAISMAGPGARSTLVSTPPVSTPGRARRSWRRS